MGGIMRDKDAINGLMIPLLFILGVLGTGVILVILDFLFNLGFS